jgi:hypothetical protein
MFSDRLATVPRTSSVAEPFGNDSTARSDATLAPRGFVLCGLRRVASIRPELAGAFTA